MAKSFCYWRNWGSEKLSKLIHTASEQQSLDLDPAGLILRVLYFVLHFPKHVKFPKHVTSADVAEIVAFAHWFMDSPTFLTLVSS